jgi:hypothetical protein
MLSAVVGRKFSRAMARFWFRRLVEQHRHAVGRLLMVLRQEWKLPPAGWRWRASSCCWALLTMTKEGGKHQRR